MKKGEMMAYVDIWHDGRNYRGKAFVLKAGRKYVKYYLYNPYEINWRYDVFDEVSGRVSYITYFEKDSETVKELVRLIEKAKKLQEVIEKGKEEERVDAEVELKEVEKKLWSFFSLNR